MITGLAHAGFSVGNLESVLAFMGDQLGCVEIKSQVSDQPYLSKVTGFEGASLKIGFVRNNEWRFPVEIIEYVNPRGQPAGNGFGVAGTQTICFSVRNIAEFQRKLIAQDITPANLHGLYFQEFSNTTVGCYFTLNNGFSIELMEENPDTKAEPKLLSIHHISLTVTSLAQYNQFFCEHFGFLFENQAKLSKSFNAPAPVSGNDFEPACLVLKRSGITIRLQQFKKRQKPNALMSHNNFGSGHLCFLTDDIFSDFIRLKNAGFGFAGEPAEVTAGINKGAYAIYFSGPDGFRFELFQKPMTRG